MSAPTLDRCTTCGQPVPDVPACPHCGRSLRVDVLLRAPLADPKASFQLARAIAGLAVTGLSFGEARAALARGGLLAGGLPRAPARALLGLLEEAGVESELRSADLSPPGQPVPARSRGLGLVLLGAAVVAILGAAVVLGRGRGTGEEPAPTPGPGMAIAAAPPGEAPASTIVAAATAAPDALPAAPAAGPPLPTPEILRRATPATALVKCQGKIGAGFFVDAERLVTNAHVVCGQREELQITTGDGRSLLGRVEAQDEWLDWAVVRVPGAGVAAPLPLGDPTALQQADPILIIGSPKGLAGTVHEGRVSFVGRNLHGVAYVQVNAAVNPGNSGGPVLDTRGRVVGIVSLKVNDADGMGLALPVEYVRPALAELPPLDAAATARFADLRRRVEAEDAAEVARMRSGLARPVLLDVSAAGPRAVTVVVMQRWAGRPGSARVSLEIHHDGQVLCRPETTVSAWVDLQQKVKELADQQAERRVAWLLRHELMTDVHAGGGLVSLDACPATLPPGARVKLQGTDGDGAWARLPPVGSRGVQEAFRARVEQDRAREAGQRRQAEGEWRQAFVLAKARVRQLTEQREQLRRDRDSPFDINTRSSAERALPAVEQALREAQEDLDDLERQASLQGVPRAWR